MVDRLSNRGAKSCTAIEPVDEPRRHDLVRRELEVSGDGGRDAFTEADALKED